MPEKILKKILKVAVTRKEVSNLEAEVKGFLEEYIQIAIESDWNFVDQKRIANRTDWEQAKRSERNTEKKRRKYEDIFLMIGSLPEYRSRRVFVRQIALLFPQYIEEEVDKIFTDKQANYALKVSILGSVFRHCICALLYSGGLHQYTRGGEKNGEGKGQFTYIPSRSEAIISLYIKRDSFLMKGKKFIDIGCGIGDKTILVHMLPIPIQAYGLEYDYVNVNFGRKAASLLPNYCGHCGWVAKRGTKRERFNNFCTNPKCNKNGEKIVNKGKRNEYKYYDFKYKCPESRFIVDDAFKRSFSNYDRIYTYQPLCETKLLIEFYHHIWQTLKPKTEWLEISSGYLRNALRRRNFSFKAREHLFIKETNKGKKKTTKK